MNRQSHGLIHVVHEHFDAPSFQALDRNNSSHIGSQAMSNLFADLPASLPEELIDILANDSGVRIERIVSQGHSSPAGFWYDQSEHEWVILLQGHAVIRYESGEEVRLGVGDYLFLPAHKKHQVIKTSLRERTVWLAVFWPAGERSKPRS